MAAAQVAPFPARDLMQYAERRRMVDSALGTTLAEGISPGPEVIALSERFVSGEITLQELTAAVRAIDGL